MQFRTVGILLPGISALPVLAAAQTMPASSTIARTVVAAIQTINPDRRAAPRAIGKSVAFEFFGLFRGSE
jgi:hypothetical protein